DLAFALMLAAARRTSEAEAALRAGRWTGFHINEFLGRDIHGATLGLVGYGRIARAVARRAVGFGMEVVHHTRTPTGEAGWVGHGGHPAGHGPPGLGLGPGRAGRGRAGHGAESRGSFARFAVTKHAPGSGTRPTPAVNSGGHPRTPGRGGLLMGLVLFLLLLA